MIIREIKNAPFTVVGCFDWFNDYKDTRSYAVGCCLPEIVALLDAGYALWQAQRAEQMKADGFSDQVIGRVIRRPAAMIDWNLNNLVRVKLTPLGREIYMLDNERVGIESGPPIEDADGWCKMPMWELMQLFGARLHMGMVNLPFGMNVQISS